MSCEGPMRGEVVAVCISGKRTEPKHDVGSGFLRAGFGLVGDSHAGTPREVSLLAQESVERLPPRSGISTFPGCFAENLLTRGLDLLSLPIGTRLKVGEAVIEVIQRGKPPSEVHTYSYAGYSLLPTEGVFARVVRSGWVRAGDPIEVVEG